MGFVPHWIPIRGSREPKVIIKMKIVCEERADEGLRTFKNDVCGTIRTIESGAQESDWKNK